MVNNKKEHQKLKENYISSILWLVEAISVAGERLNKYIQGHPKAPHEEVLEHVSSILKFYDFCPAGEDVNIESLNLSPYKLPPPTLNKPKKRGGKTAAGKVATEEKLIVGKNLPGSWDLMCERKRYFPFWRSVLALGYPVKVYPGHAVDDKQLRHVKSLCQSRVTPAQNIDLIASMRQPSKRLFGTAALVMDYQSKRLFGTAALTSNYQSKRLFGTAALMLLKVLKKA